MRMKAKAARQNLCALRAPRVARIAKCKLQIANLFRDLAWNGACTRMRHERTSGAASGAADRLRAADRSFSTSPARRSRIPTYCQSTVSELYGRRCKLSSSLSWKFPPRLHREARRPPEESDESVFWLIFIKRGDYASGDELDYLDARNPGHSHGLREDSQFTSRPPRLTPRFPNQSALCNRQFAIYRRLSMISSRASLPGRTRSSGSEARGSSTMFSWVRKSSRSGSM